MDVVDVVDATDPVDPTVPVDPAGSLDPADPDDTARRLRDTAEELQLVVSLMVRHLRTASAGSGLTLGQVSVLRRLDREGPRTITELARAERIRPQSLNSTVAALRAGGHVERAAHPTDGRRKVIALTDRGRRVAAERQEAGRGRLADLMARRLAPAEQQTVAEAVPLLRRLAEA
ncbi:MarR family winged helix-turn-helix transcriptional regulator [Streptomyces sp. NPDC058623]|uniref:MarR family winged helix-turn-helix transcriptional regulator n=1 Tax=Streptomyces sp. NPDC058623 TaxID=3346563 RepID=UPI003667DE93